MEFVGLTGPVRFKEGRRSNITLDLLKLKRENLTKVGEWNGQMGLNITDPVAFYEGSTPNVTLIVMTNEVGKTESVDRLLIKHRAHYRALAVSACLATIRRSSETRRRHCDESQSRPALIALPGAASQSPQSLTIRQLTFLRRERSGHEETREKPLSDKK